MFDNIESEAEGDIENLLADPDKEYIVAEPISNNKEERTVSRTGAGTHQNFIIGCRYFLKMRRLYQTTGTNQQFFIRCRYFSCFYLFVTL